MTWLQPGLVDLEVYRMNQPWLGSGNHLKVTIMMNQLRLGLGGYLERAGKMSALAGPCRLRQQDRLVPTKCQGPTEHGCEDGLANARPSQPLENRFWNDPTPVGPREWSDNNEWNEPAMAELHELFREDRSTHAEPCHQNTKDRVQSYVPEQSVRIGEAGCVPGTLERPHRSSYFLPGKLKRQPVHFLIDTGCNTKLLSKRVFDHLPERVRNSIERK